MKTKEQLRKMYLEDVVGNGKDSEDSSTDDNSDPD